MLALVALCGAALAGASALGARFWGVDRSRRALAITALWLAIVLLPIHLLGWLGAVGVPHALSRSTLGASVLLLSVAACAVGIGRADPWDGARRALSAGTDLLGLIVDGIRQCVRARSLALLGLLAVLVIVSWTAYGAWLAPSSAWDGVFYHEAMIGFAIQNEGFALGDLPPGLAPIAGYPRMAESLSLFFVMFLDRRLIELPGSPMLLVITLAAYTMMRRWVPSRSTAIGLATGLALLPGIVLQLRSTYIDTVALGFFVIALAFSTRPDLRSCDVVLAAITIGMVGASKSTGFLLAPVMTAVLLARVLVRMRVGVVARVGLALGVAAVVASIAAPTYVRNWIDHENPLWPGRVHFALLGIDWRGPLDVAAHDRPFAETIRMLFAPPIAGQQYHDTRDNGYGNTPPFVILPLAIFALLHAPYVGIRAALLGDRRAVHSAGSMLVAVAPIAATFAFSPAKFWARLNLHVVVALWLAAAWLAGRVGRSLGEGIVGAVVIGGIMTLAWSEPAWDIPRDRVARLARLAHDERAVQADGMITLAPTEIARQREALPERALVVFADHPFPAQLWTERFDNRVEWLPPSTPDWIDVADRLGATWVVVPRSGSLIARLRADERWTELGPAVREADVYAFSRRSSARPDER